MAKVAKIDFAYFLEHEREVLLELSGERKRSLLWRFAEGSLRTTIVKQVLVQGLMIVDVPVDIHAGEVVVEFKDSSFET
ncbi:hypothetical protein PsorP6_011907 [Peronosclerospora sorghi]|uniref:Uncharacterized protein n=1 Tax=Peronosclerospora sorghi TaxID=230839 RepID=A0ACC0WK34_9STRA|nr:hypothetical protein PsorP6_011907 [Peronosclerospora sorghi]